MEILKLRLSTLMVIVLKTTLLTFWRRNYFFNLSTPCI